MKTEQTIPTKDCDELMELKAKLKQLDDAIFISERLIRGWFKHMVPEHCRGIDTIEQLESMLTKEKKLLEKLKNGIPPEAKWYQLSEKLAVTVAKERYADMKEAVTQLEHSIHGYKTHTDLDDKIKELAILQNCRNRVRVCIKEMRDNMHRTLCK